MERLSVEPIEQARRLHATHIEPGDLNVKIQEILNKLLPKLEVWNDISKDYRLDLFYGLFMKNGVEGTFLTADGEDRRITKFCQKLTVIRL